MTEPTETPFDPRLPFAWQGKDAPEPVVKYANLVRGDTCPVCQKAPLDWDGFLNLSCPECGFTLGSSCFT